MVRDLCLLGMRLIVGGIFAAHGYPKLFGGQGKEVSTEAARYLGQGFVEAVQRGSPAGFAPAVQRLGLPGPIVVAWFVAGLEFFGGVMLAIGWLTRPTAFLLAGEMATATLRVHWRNGLIAQGGFEFPLSLLGACLGLIGTGPGAMSVDGAENTCSVEQNC
ncbi:MAG TPA: DoxX family protein [Chloroflexota bacterium]|nr:DoxX family protein [Chloroflexota bacterium]